jgi:hypothetical protein
MFVAFLFIKSETPLRGVKKFDYLESRRHAGHARAIPIHSHLHPGR